MKNYILPFVLLFSIYFSYAQTIKGVVLDAKTEQPIVGAHVYFNNTNNAALTNKKGKFKLKLPIKKLKNNTIHFSHIGYKNKELIYYKNEKNYSIHLLDENLKLEEVKLLSKKKLKSKIQYKELIPMESELHSFGSLQINNKIYVFGGDKTLHVDAYRKIIDDHPGISLGEMLRKARTIINFENYSENLFSYDIESNHWKTENMKLRKRAYHNTVYVPDNGKIYILGGKRYSRNKAFEYLDDKIEVFDMHNKTIEIDNTNPHQAVNAASFVYKDKIIVMGGSIKKKKNGKKIFSNKIHMFDIKSGLWYALNDMPTAKELNGVVLNDKIYIFGGYNGKTLNGVETYDLITGRWKKEGELFSSMNNPAIAQSNETIYLFENGKIFSYNTTTKELKKYFIGLYLNASKMFVVNNKTYILGGFTKDEFSTTPSRNLYSVNLNEFEKTKIIKVRNFNSMAVN